MRSYPPLATGSGATRPRATRLGVIAILLALLVQLVPLGTAEARRKKKPKKKPPAEETKPVEPAPVATPDPAPEPTPVEEVRSEPPTTPLPAAPTAAAESAAVDVDSLRQEYLKLRDELFESRARAATVASALYSTRLQVKLAFTTARFYGVTRAVVRLDGASVFDDSGGAVATDDAVRFDGWIAPGRHVLTFRVETVGKDDERFTSATEATVVVQAVAGKDLAVIAKASDGGNIAYEWKRHEKGGYRLGIDVDVRTQARATAEAGKKTARAR